jgi:hypothetical protein
MYTPGVIRLAGSYSPKSEAMVIDVVTKPQYTTPRRMLGTRREMYGEGRRSRTVGMISRKLFG